MADPITAIYVQENDDWTITVSGRGKTLTGRAPGIIAARDSVDQLVDKLGPDAKESTVVHLLNGSALEFTSAYMTARLTRPEPAPLEVPQSSDSAEESAEETDSDPADQASHVPAQKSDEAPVVKPKNKASRRPKAKLTADIGDALSKSSALPAASGTVTVAGGQVSSASA
ncbi:hypothetical protein HFP15_37700 [Amycolatopsis sp. K13G38]|uniref:DUF2188 domain-containing protein n=1 Tax=Amycolatopsis acididurans TaxID=2724524 RepID=A0ABX1JIC5_9PSEU|nr:hypothetical protein [Amycolatopsis acididurans]NKQ58595.1 hypothetical protein [Amycolatopsis acididurans]